MSVPSCSTSKEPDGVNTKDEVIYEKWERFSNWVHCICIVTFDLELGQAIEAIYPSHVKLSEQERSNVCYLAFPDSNSGCMGDTQYHVRIRQNSKMVQETNALKEYNRKSSSFLQTDKDYYWGYVYFRQVKDKSLPRGYFQKSVVIITKLPFVNLFGELCALIAPEFFEAGMALMEAVIREIDHWPPPVPGQIVHLPLIGVLFQTYIPNQNYKATIPSIAAMEHAPNVHATRRLILTSAYEGDMFRSLASVVSYVHLLWELVLLSEPIVVMAGSPTTCSEMVQALIAMIAPLKYCADHRPYFTIHDSEFKEYTADSPTPPAVILGVTNPFFAKTLQHWPHIIRISNGNNSEDQRYKIKKSENLKVLDSKPGVYTQYKPFLQKDKTILKKLFRGVQTKRPGEVQTALLKRHLMELTESFMIPLERYIATLMPLQKNISPFKATPTPQMFNPDDFLASLSSSGPQLTTGIKGDWVGLYKRFFRSPNFSGWFHTRYTELSQQLQVKQLEKLSQADLKTWVQGKHEVEVVDMILRIRQKLEKSCIDDVPIDNSVREKLRERIDDITHVLPDDLKVILRQES
ncbi:protein DENND6A isoform X1 [Pseudomyrmex gracilis]|uniref:protein DENND6A isoform X1 n=1 Tax=Pseudomyrmex gracilis TaxID=219809 RepID=UPI000994E74F|nr:protein DENND6A isoform X1 [Pseudomyrmex gracilis]